MTNLNLLKLMDEPILALTDHTSTEGMNIGKVATLATSGFFREHQFILSNYFIIVDLDPVFNFLYDKLIIYLVYTM